VPILATDGRVARATSHISSRALAFTLVKRGEVSQFEAPPFRVVVRVSAPQGKTLATSKGETRF